MSRTSLTRRPVALAAAGLMAFSSVAVGATGALVPQAVAQEANASTIDVDREGSITLHKRLDAARVQDATGNLQIADGSPLPGVVFSIQQVQADLSTNDGLRAARALTPATAEDDPEGVSEQKITDENGIAHFGDLPVGVYRVSETIPETVEGTILPARDFLVWVPQTNPENQTEWNYDVQVYPKNSSASVEKEVDDADQNVGDEIEYTITTKIPRVEQLSKYVVFDDLDEEKLELTAEQREGITASLTAGDVELEKGVHYNVEVSEDLEVEVVFTGLGRAALLAAPAYAEVETTIPATLKEIGEGNGQVLNEATNIINNSGSTFLPGEPGSPEDPTPGEPGEPGDPTPGAPTDPNQPPEPPEPDVEIPSNEVETRLGKLKIEKSGEDDQPLPGATFELYRCEDPQNLIGDNLTVAGEDSWTTDQSGEVTIDGLHVTDFENNAPIEEKYKYCLVEVEAPQGYQLLSTPVEVEFTTAAVGNILDGTDAVTQVAKIENTRSGFLPNTGGAGVVLLLIVGALLAGSGVYAAARNAKKA